MKRHDDLLARAGGDEFFMLLNDLPTEAEAHAVTAATRVAAILAEPFPVAGASLHVSASVGMSVSRPTPSARTSCFARRTPRCTRPSAPAAPDRDVPEAQDPLERLSLTARLRRSIDRPSWSSTTSRSSRSRRVTPWG